MKHLGDITKISGFEAPPVDCICGGSPCQDLSVAGKRAGLAGERSGLYMEQIRIIREMREADVLRGRSGIAVRPRYMVWENVPGAFSSNHGKDFAAVLEEAVRVAEPEAPPVPVPDKGWPKSGYIYDDLGNWSVAWREHDAQYWGVAQRRKRIALLADFGGLTAGDIMFDPQLRRKTKDSSGLEAFVDTGERGGLEVLPQCQGLPWNPSQSRTAWKEVAGDPETGSGASSYTLKIRGGGVAVDSSGKAAGKGALIQTELSATLGVSQDQTLFQREEPVAYGIDLVITTGGNCTAQGPCIYPDVEATLKASGVHAVFDTRTVKPVAYAIGAYESNAWKSGNPNSGVYETEVCKTLDAMNCGNPACNMGGTAVVFENHSQDTRFKEMGDTCTTITQQYWTGGNNQPLVLESNQNHATITDSGITPTLPASMGMGGGYVPMVALAVGNGQANQSVGEVVGALNCMHDQQAILTSECIPDVAHALKAKANLQFREDSETYIADTEYSVRRLTPTECERLQGFPDGWTNLGEWVDTKGKKHRDADSCRYKALGNSIALPFWYWLIQRISAQYDRPATLGSLFDGIGGFPLCWEKCNGKGTALWASEIEEFPIAVTKYHFPEVDT